jgi:hypothetical protein
MDVFAQKKYLLRISVLLFSMNIILISIFVWKEMHRPEGFHRPPGPPHHRVNIQKLNQILKEKLELNEEQLSKFKSLRSKFHQEEYKVLSLLRSQRDSMNVEMFRKESDDAFLNGLAQRVSENEHKMELLKIKQARELKSICTEEQLEKFEDFVFEIREYFKPEHRKP